MIMLDLVYNEIYSRSGDNAKASDNAQVRWEKVEKNFEERVQFWLIKVSLF